MKNFDWSKWSAISEILSAVAIVATLLYLAAQTQYLAEQTEQNNRLLSAQAEYNFLQTRLDISTRAVTDDAFAGLLMKLEDGSPLTELERYKAVRLRMETIQQMQWEYYETNNRSLDIDLEAQGCDWARVIFGARATDQYYTEAYDRLDSLLRNDFIEFLRRKSNDASC